MAVQDFRGQAGKTAFAMMWTVIGVILLIVCCVCYLCIWSYCCKTTKSKKHSELYSETNIEIKGYQNSKAENLENSIVPIPSSEKNNVYILSH